MPDNTNILIIRSARPEVLTKYMETIDKNAHIYLITSKFPKLNSIKSKFKKVFLLPPEQINWNLFDKNQKQDLKDIYWKEIVILHNKGGNYGAIYRLILKISPLSPVTVFFESGEDETFNTAFKCFLTALSQGILRKIFKKIGIITWIFYPLVLLIIKIRLWHLSLKKSDFQGKLK